ncbi:hypothetical protein I5Q34_05445 [Streptomyces sp. AV19]|uniref:hypothetical protein n=1 Tax=Streptomyces sp. AV19 TaxID=2793068 RepID=UPI0018FE5E0A|nr:hypothetical protein [Streptomyces sp. AV19]MBH1933744.1 hypothetical protein [Streptomyces sp. AV19]MDG4535751.1 hypothetical protein [Streptomyces sp. AV19]
MSTESTDEDPGAKTGPRHAAPRKPLLARLHMPAGKAIALAAMPTAVLMGMGFTPQLAQAKPVEPPNPFGDAFCLTKPDASPSPSPDATPGTPSPSPDASRTADADDKPKSSGKVPPSPAGTPSPSPSPKAKPKSTPSPTPSPTEDPVEKDRGKLPGSLPLPLPPMTASPSPTPTDTPTPTPTPSAKSPESPESPKSPAPTPSNGALKKAPPSPTPKATPQPRKTLDVPETPEATPTPDASGSASPSPSATPSPTATGEKTPKPCPTTKAGPDRQQAGFANNPWFLEASKLTLRGLTYEGIKEITTIGGQKKSVVKFTADGLDIKDLHALVNDRGKVFHQRGPGPEVPTIRGGKVTLYTEELKGKLLGIPMTVNASHPPPLIPGLKLPIPISYTDVKIRQAGQYGGTLTIPNMKVYITDGTYP